jgi:hypothetical protein
MLLTLLSIAITAAWPSAPTSARIALVFDAGTPASMRTLIVQEAARVWAPYGIALADASGSPPAGDGLLLRVAIVDRSAPDTNDHALGSIPFHDGVFDASISLYAGTASGLVSAALESSGAPGASSPWPPAYYDALLGRVLGRALAHEIGHYLLHTRNHSASGLMRAAQPIRSLMEASDHRLVLTADEVAVLREWLCVASENGVKVALHREPTAESGVDGPGRTEAARNVEAFRVRIADHVEDLRVASARDAGTMVDQFTADALLPEVGIDEQRVEFGVAVRSR